MNNALRTSLRTENLCNKSCENLITDLEGQEQTRKK